MLGPRRRALFRSPLAPTPPARSIHQHASTTLLCNLHYPTPRCDADLEASSGTCARHFVFSAVINFVSGSICPVVHNVAWHHIHSATVVRVMTAHNCTAATTVGWCGSATTLHLAPRSTFTVCADGATTTKACREAFYEPNEPSFWLFYRWPSLLILSSISSLFFLLNYFSPSPISMSSTSGTPTFSVTSSQTASASPTMEAGAAKIAWQTAVYLVAVFCAMAPFPR